MDGWDNEWMDGWMRDERVVRGDEQLAGYIYTGKEGGR